MRVMTPGLKQPWAPICKRVQRRVCRQAHLSRVFRTVLNYLTAGNLHYRARGLNAGHKLCTGVNEKEPETALPSSTVPRITVK